MFLTTFKIGLLFFVVNLIAVNEAAAVEDPVAFTAIKGGRNDAYISFQALVVNNKASRKYSIN